MVLKNWNDAYSVKRMFTIKYSEKELPLTLNCFGILRDEKK